MCIHSPRGGRAVPATAIALALATPALAAEEPGALQDMLVRDSKLRLHLRSEYFDRHKAGGVIQAAWAAGGWLAYQSGWLGDLVRLGAVGYTSQPIWAPADTAGNNLLGQEQQSLSVIGQAYVSLKRADQVHTGARFEVNPPEVNPNDIRMLPNICEGGSLTGGFGDKPVAVNHDAA